MTNDFVRRIGCNTLQLPRVGAAYCIGSETRMKVSRDLDPATATIWAFDDGSAIGLDDKTQIGF